MWPDRVSNPGPLTYEMVEVTDSAVLGGDAEVVSSNPTVGHKNIFQHLPA